MAPLARSLRSKDYTVAWISAIQKEYLIACAVLDDEHNHPIDIGNDDNCYTFGSIGEHNVVVASLPMARIGVTQAGMLATEMLRTFPKLRFGLMIGIAGGAPTSKNDIRLGDVVVSIPDDHKRLGGVVHYGFGATDQRKGFQRRGNLNAPPEVLLNATNKLKTKYDRQGHRLDPLIHQMIDQHAPRLDKYKRPPKETDVLYKSTFVHPEGASCCSDLCSKQDQAVVERLTRPSNLDQPVVHYGTIGSADNLMKDASLRDQLASSDGILCFEMEAAGLMNSDLRCIVVRGICDYSDTHKNDDWQEYAAAAAAMYAKELLGVVRALKTRRVGTFGVTKLLTGHKPGKLLLYCGHRALMILFRCLGHPEV
jgi:nucleoside phosphorylase